MDTAVPRTLSLLPPPVDRYFPQHIPFLRYGTHGDGTCFFHSVCAAHNEQGYLQTTASEQKRIGRQYRRDFTKHVTDSKWNSFCDANNIDDITPEQARRNFRNSRHWANQGMIQFVADTLKLNILFIDTNKSKLYCGVHGDSKEPLIVILWVQQAHFEPVGACRAVDGQKTGVQFMFDPVKDAAVVDHIMNKYKGQCSA